MKRWMQMAGMAPFAAGLSLVMASPAGACGGLIGPRGAVNLERTTTLAAYHDGVEHYVTAFSFSGGDAQFGSLIPLPGVPTKVERGGKWTLQRLEREVNPPREIFAAARASSGGVADKAQVLLSTKIDALDLTVLKGGGQSVGQWATEHGFVLPPDAPEVLDFYAQRSPIFLAARFDAAAARQRGQEQGDGTPVHITMPTTNPWVPLRILGLGKEPQDGVNADVFLLTDRRPSVLPVPDAPDLQPGSAVHVQREEPASTSLLADLRSDDGMQWIPDSMELTYLTIDGPAATVHHDLAIDASGNGHPSARLAGIELASSSHGKPLPLRPQGDNDVSGWQPILLWSSLLGVVAVAVAGVRRALRGSR